jgi:medium-chain acyl-[acyl-carrier-protein] hydrolase
MQLSPRSSFTPWIAGPPPAAGARLRLFCFPFAGVGASAFRSWGSELGPCAQLCPVQLPGRESRQNEPPFRRMDVLVDATLKGLAPYLDVPFAFFGHSMGALVAFELARRLLHEPMLRRVFVSARQAPHLSASFSPIAHLPSPKFVAAVQQRYGGIPEPVLACPDLLELLLPRLRADFEVLETYLFRPGIPLRCGISVFGGTTDTVSESELNAWREHTSGSMRLRMLKAGHFYLDSSCDALMSAIADDLALDRRGRGVTRCA